MALAPTLQNTYNDSNKIIIQAAGVSFQVLVPILLYENLHRNKGWRNTCLTTPIWKLVEIKEYFHFTS